MPDSETIKAFVSNLKKDIKGKGYYLNPNEEDLEVVIEGLLTNQESLGYLCCRVPGRSVEEDRDIICPCVYMYDDVSEHGNCYCALYVDEEIYKGDKQAKSIPERRGMGEAKMVDTKRLTFKTDVWRCTVCGYLCAKDVPPAKCPICGVPKDRFEIFN